MLKSSDKVMIKIKTNEMPLILGWAKKASKKAKNYQGRSRS